MKTFESYIFGQFELARVAMASFFDDEAVESDDEELSDEEERAKVCVT